MSEVATYMKVGTTALVLSMIEDNVLGEEWILRTPVRSILEVSHDPTLRQTIPLRDGRRVTALEVQWGLFERAQKYERSHGLDPLGAGVGADILERWEMLLTGLEADPDSMAHWIDWVAKRRLVEGYAERHDIQPGAAKLKAIDLQYHDLRAERCLAHRAGLDTLVGSEEVLDAIDQPPESTRAYFRGRCLQKYPDDIVAANWDSLVFDVGRDPLRRVPMMEPLRGTADHVATLIDQSETAGELLDRLGQ
jgi:proteasome accessory factor A